jgi:hypothetical protein
MSSRTRLVFDEDYAATLPEEARKGVLEGTWQPIIGFDTPEKPEKAPEAASKEPRLPLARISDLPEHLRPRIRAIVQCVSYALCACQS